ncbi:MAG: acetylglutamate kinase [Paramuribaculum sp.]|nr:acetylglutamate kinase [Paramuribaculum sp.]
MKKPLTVIKIGGNVVDNPEMLSCFISDFSQYNGDKILVHGGGKEATRMSAALGLETVMIEGRRVTDAATLEVVTMVYAGLVNKRVVAGLQAAGVDALGMTGADGHVVTGVRRNPVPIDYGFVGDLSPDGVNVSLLAGMLDNGVVPVMSAIAHDGKGQLLNCNADTVASTLAVAMSQERDVTLVYCFELPGVLSNPDDITSVIPYINESTFKELKSEGVVSGGMIPKITNAFNAINSGVGKVVIKHASGLLDNTATVICR